MRIVLAEDHEMFAEVVTKVCITAGHQIIATVRSGDDALAACFAGAPDLLILDLRLPHVPGGVVVENLERVGKLPKLLVISGHLSEYVVFRLDRLSVPFGVLDKDRGSLAALESALAAMELGRRWLCTTYVRMLHELRSNPHSFLRVLSERQQQFLCYIARDYDDDQIAEELRVSIRTVEGYRSTILHKLRLSNSLKLASYGRERGFDLFLTAASRETADLRSCVRS